MTPDEWHAVLEQRIEYAETVEATARVADVLAAVLGELDHLEMGNGKKEEWPDRMLKAEDVAKRLNVSVRTVYKNRTGWPFARKFPGGSVRFSEKGLQRWLDRQR
jgi:predicted DNA-binding transcriptional regulator AlpA